MIPALEEKDEDVIFFSKRELATNPAVMEQLISITAGIECCDIRRVLVDTGAAKDILYYQCFRELQFTDAHLQPYPGKLEGFTNHKLNTKGTIMLEVTLGQAPKARTEPVTFLVIDLRSSYNAILGAPALSKFGLVASFPH